MGVLRLFCGEGGSTIERLVPLLLFFGSAKINALTKKPCLSRFSNTVQIRKLYIDLEMNNTKLIWLEDVA
jgi:hypothetical protein